MFTNKDLEYRSIFVINCFDDKNLRVQSGELLLENSIEKKTLTKLPFQKILALFIVGNITITSPLIEKCTKFGIPLVVMKHNFRPTFFFSITAEANFLLRQKQYKLDKNNLQIPKILMENKLKNQLRLLEKTRMKSSSIEKSKNQLTTAIQEMSTIEQYEMIMGIEGRMAKSFFSSYFEKLDWKARLPRTKIDPINATLDIGYTVLFNYIEVFSRLFGFDPYVGVYHRLWFKRKSLICDLMEPFRCLIDQQVRKGFNNQQFKSEDFYLFKNEYILKREMNSVYSKIFFEVLIEYKMEVFNYIRDYYRCFMQDKKSIDYPQFLIK